VSLGLAAVAFVLALAQRPGTAITDTKIDLQVDAVDFLGEVASSWTSTGSLGHIWGSQYVGYLFPQGPFYALGELLGLSPWLTTRLWLGLVLALGAWGVVRLLDALLGRTRGAAHVVAGALYLLNPYVIVMAPWRSVHLLAYAALPWLLLAVHRGVREPRRWWWPAAFALVVIATAPGVNAALTGFVLLGPILLALYEPLLGGVAWRAVGAFAWRASALTIVASLWWLVPVLVQVRYGVDFQQFTEGPAAIWQTTGLSESLRLMGFWLAYTSTGTGALPGPYLSDAPPLLFDTPVVVASLLVPALALGGFALTRRWRYGPFFLLLAIVGALTLTVGFPEGTVLRDALLDVHDRLAVSRILRTTYKAAPLLALGLACLGGAAAGIVWERLRGRAWRALAAAAAAVLLAAAAWPMTSGDSAEDIFAWERIPAAWTEVAHDVGRDLEANTRAVVLPGQLFGYYTWGGTFDPILPALADRRVAGRFLVPWADLRATDLLWTTDSLVQEGRVQPDQLARLLELMGAGSVVAGTDDERDLSGAAGAAEAARELARSGFGRADRAYGPVRAVAPADGNSGAPLALPQVRRYDLAGGRGIVRVAPRGPLTVVDGSADALAALAAFGPLPAAPMVYAADRSREQLQRAARQGASFVVSDSNRRRVFAASRLLLSDGATIAGDQSFSADAALLDPWPERGPEAQTVAVVEGARGVRAPYSAQARQFPERRPFAAFDGDPRTAWLADQFAPRDRLWVELRLERPTDVSRLEVLPYGDSRGRPAALSVEGRTYELDEGWNRLPVELRATRRLRLRIERSVTPSGEEASAAGGLREVRVPGLRLREWLRTPRLVSSALAGMDLRRNDVSILLERTTAPRPFQPREAVGDLHRGRVRDSRDAEDGLARLVALPAARSFDAEARVSVSPSAPDDALDRLAGTTAGARMRSSSRFEGRPSLRASAAFDGDPRGGWVGEWAPGRRAWIEWKAAAAAVPPRRLQVSPAPGARAPTLVRLWAGPVASDPLRVDPAGGVEVAPGLPRARRLRLEVLDAAWPSGTPAWMRERPAVGIAELGGPGLPRVRTARRTGAVPRRCGDVVVHAAGRALRLRVEGPLADLEAGRPLAARSCGPARLPVGEVRIEAPPGVFRVDHLQLHSAAPQPVARPASAGRVVDPGSGTSGRVDGVELRLSGPAWLVLGEGYSRGWRASCDGRDLGEPVPVDGFANGWPVEAGCREAAFSFEPGQAAKWVGLLSGLACLAMLVLLAVRRPAAADPDPAPLPDDAPGRLSLVRALGAGALAALVLGAVFALRSGLVLGPLVALALWRGAPARTLAVCAGALLAAVPLVYVLFPPDDQGGWNTDYSKELLGAHWVAAAAVTLLIVALGRMIRAGRGYARSPRGSPDGLAHPPGV